MRALKIFYAQNRITFLYLALSPFLFIMSGIYAFFSFALRFLYSRGILASYRSKARLISVGNITLGGSGKTPMVEYLASRLSGEGHKVVILLRGYKRPKKSDTLGAEDYYVLGDEGGLLKENLRGRVVVSSGRNRARAAKQLDDDSLYDTIILDDGFQHWRLQRDLDIVMVSAVNPFGNRLLLPAGPLREGVSCLKRASVFCLTHCDETEDSKIVHLTFALRAINPQALILKSVHAFEYLYNLRTGHRLFFEMVKEKPLCLLCGIANPASFEATVAKLGGKIFLRKFFDDHHIFTEVQMRHLIDECLKAGVKTILTTQKDAQRLEKFLRGQEVGVDVLAVRITLKIVEGQESLDERLHSLYRL